MWWLGVERFSVGDGFALEVVGAFDEFVAVVEEVACGETQGVEEAVFGGGKGFEGAIFEDVLDGDL